MRKTSILVSLPISGGEAYVKAIVQAGGHCTALYAPCYLAHYDGLVLCGGGDMHPHFLGEKNLGSYAIDIERDRAELLVFWSFFREKKPIFAICRGHQLVHVALGGKLCQHMREPALSRHYPQNGAGDAYHGIVTEKDTVLRKLLGERLMVNSYHHQSVNLCARAMKVSARDLFGAIEATEHETLPIITTQFHPERMEMGAVFAHFVGLCRDR